MGVHDRRGTGVATTKEAVAGAGIGGSVAVLAGWALATQGIAVPPEAATAMGSLFGLIASWLVPIRR